MRLWSLHPEILDRAALVACWREGLLAQKVLAGGTRGYTKHPQLTRFRAHPEPLAAIGAYLSALQEEATRRGYRFDAARILQPSAPSAAGSGALPPNAPAPGAPAPTPAECLPVAPIPVTTGQLTYELEHLRTKVAVRAPERLATLPAPGTEPAAHPLLRVVSGEIEEWEVI